MQTVTQEFTVGAVVRWECPTCGGRVDVMTSNTGDRYVMTLGCAGCLAYMRPYEVSPDVCLDYGEGSTAAYVGTLLESA